MTTNPPVHDSRSREHGPPNAGSDTPSGSPVLDVKGLTYYHPTSSGNDGISDITFSLKKGEFLSVVGPSGCGKSTLLFLIAGLIRGYSGQIHVNDEPVTVPRPDVGVVFQQESTFSWRTALGNVEFGLQMRGVDRKTRRERASEMLAQVGLKGFEGHYPGELSGGMKQRVAIARTVVTRPALLLMDEPFGALDEQTRETLGTELVQLQQDLNQTILFITHSIQEAVRLSDKVLVLNGHPGTTADLLNVDLPRPREPTIITHPDYIRSIDHVWRLIH